jgi:hypothetical protein
MTEKIYSESDREQFNDPFGDTTRDRLDDDYPARDTKDYTSVLARIERHQQKANPAVLATPVIINGGALWGGISNQIQFTVDGKVCPVYSLLIWSTATATVTLNLGGNVANAKDGLPVTATTPPIVLQDFQLERLSVLYAGTAAQSITVNGPADSTLGGLFIYAWTTEEYIGKNK